MLNNTQLTVVRNVATAIVATLATLQVLYPNYTWVTAVTVAFATLGIHANVSSQQMKGNTMTDGLTAMGLKPAEQTQAAPAEAAPVPVETPVQEAPDVNVAPVVPDNSPAKQALTDAANALLKIAESL